MSEEAFTADFTEDQLLVEARDLARSVILLSDRDSWAGEKGELAAIWGGAGIVPLPAELVVTDEDEIDDGHYFQHWISLDTRFLPAELKLRGCLSIYVNEGDEQHAVLHDELASLTLDTATIPLYAYPRTDLPHIDALFVSGSDGLRRALALETGKPAEQLTNNLFGFRNHPVIDRLVHQLSDTHPLWAQDTDLQIAAQIGGWPWGWPDGDWDEREKAGQRLILWTFRDAEPWLEVWWKDGEFEVVSRIT